VFATLDKPFFQFATVIVINEARWKNGETCDISFVIKDLNLKAPEAGC
jgi:hypothetical protein